MTRTSPSAADTQLLAAAASAGHQVSYAQLERWRSMELVPRNVRRGSGRGRGSMSATPDGALEALVRVASDARQGRKMVLGDPLMRAVSMRPYPPGSIKTAVTAVFDRACVQLRADLDDEQVGPDAAGDARFEAATRATVRGAWPPMRGLADWVATGVEPPDVPAPRGAMRDVLQSLASGGRDVSLEDFTAAATATGQTRDSGDEDINAIWARLEARGTLPDWLAREIFAAEEDDEQFTEGLLDGLENWSLPAMRDRVHAALEEDLVAGAKAAMLVQSIQSMVMLFGMPRVAGHPEIIPDELSHYASVEAAQTMVSDPMFKLWTHNWPMPNGSRSWLRFLAYIAGLVVILGLLEELSDYGERLMDALHPGGRSDAVDSLRALKARSESLARAGS